MAPKPSTKPASAAKDEVVCEPGRHVNCLHAKMAEKRKAK
jgi:hypothetical protein